MPSPNSQDIQGEVSLPYLNLLLPLADKTASADDVGGLVSSWAFPDRKWPIFSRMAPAIV